jgi:ABC-type methionine transport system permease subunit
MTTIVNGQCSTFGIHRIIFTAYSLAVVGVIPPVILGVFGYLTYRNIRQAHNRIQPVINNEINANNSLRRRDRELWTMIISETFVYILTASLFPITLAQMLITQNLLTNKSVQYLQIESFLFFIATLLLFINRATPFYVYLIVSKPFRRNFVQLIIKFYRKLTRQQQQQQREQPVQIVDRTHQASRIQDTRV